MGGYNGKKSYVDYDEGVRTIDEHLSNMGKEEFCSLSIVDLDDFRDINMNYGYQTGDKVLECLVGALTEISAEEPLKRRR